MIRLTKRTIWLVAMTVCAMACAASSASAAGLTVNSGSTFTVADDTEFTANGVTVNNGGTLVLGANSTLKLAAGTTIAINQGGTLTVNGASGSTSTITRDGGSGTYSFTVAGTINAQYCNFYYIDASGLNITSTATVTSLDNCVFDNAGASSAAYITVAASIITANKTIYNITFDPDTADSNASYNVTTSGSTSYYWLFAGYSGNKSGEAYDNDGGEPGIIHWDSAPNAPQTPYCENDANPTNVMDTTPEFSAIYDDTDTSDTSSYYQIQVSTNSSFIPGGWWNGSWTMRRKLTFDNSGQAGNLTDFPVLVVLNSSRIDYSKTLSNGEDIRFVDTDGALLDHEIETWNESGTSYVWVKVPQIDGSSTTDYIYMYYGNSGASDGQDAASLWSDYSMVYHFKEPSGTLGDSTGNTSGTGSSGLLYAQTGAVGYAVDLSSASGIRCGSLGSSILTAETTVSFWIYSNNIASPARQNPFDQAYGGWGTMTLETSGTINWYFGDNGGNGDNYASYGSGSIITNGSWIYVTATRDPDGYAYNWYKDGSYETGSTYSSSYPVIATQIFTIGDGYVNPINGLMDEFRVCTIARSADWVAAEHKAMIDDAFVSSFGTEEEGTGEEGGDMWDTTKTSMSSTNEGSRCPDISYTGSSLEAGATYYWRIKFWDNSDAEGAWTAAQNFTMGAIPGMSATISDTTITVKNGSGASTSDFKLVFNEADADASQGYHGGVSGTWSTNYLSATELLTELDQDTDYKVDKTSFLELLENSPSRTILSNSYSLGLEADINENYSIYPKAKVYKNTEYQKRLAGTEARRVDDANTDFIASGMSGYFGSTPSTTRSAGITYNDYQLMDVIGTATAEITDYQNPDTLDFSVGGSISGDAAYKEEDGAITVTFGENTGNTYTGVTQDCGVAASAPTTNYDTGHDGDGIYVTLNRFMWIRFDLSSLPADATVTAVSLFLESGYLSDTANAIFSVASATSTPGTNWGETTATYNTYNGSTQWTSGADGGAGDRDTIMSSLDLNSSNPDDVYYQWVFNPSGVSYVDSKIGATADFTVYRSPTGHSRQFHCSEQVDGHRPYLKVTYVRENEYNKAQGCYTITAGGTYTTGTPQLAFDLDGSTNQRYNPVFKIRHFTSFTDPNYYIEGVLKTSGTDYIAGLVPFTDAYLMNDNSGVFTMTDIAEAGDGADTDEKLASASQNQTLTMNEAASSPNAGTPDGDALYFSSHQKFYGLNIDLETNGAGGNGEWQYWDGDSWNDISVSETATNASKFYADGAIYWGDSDVAGWQKTAVAPGDETGCVGHWNLSEGSSGSADAATIYDRSGSGNNGTANNGANNTGLTWGAGISGNAINFDGTDDIVSIGDPVDGSLDFGTTSFTYSLWVYVTLSAGEYDMPWWKGGGSAGSAGYDMELGVNAWVAGISDGTKATATYFGTESEFSNKWTYLVAVVDRSDNLLKLYANGVFRNSVDISTYGSISGTSSATIGGTSDGYYPFHGLIDEVRIFNYARTPAEIKADYERGRQYYQVRYVTTTAYTTNPIENIIKTDLMVIQDLTNTFDSASSDTVHINTLLTPAAPTLLTATAQSDQALNSGLGKINLEWSDNSSGETGFKIERKTGVGGSYSQIDTVGQDQETYSNSNLDDCTEYYYQVRAYNASGDSAYTNEANATALDRTAPNNVSGATETGGAQNGVVQSTVGNPAFTWSAPSDNTGGSGIAGYYWYFGTNSSADAVTACSPFSSTGCDPSAVSNYNRYYLRLKTEDNQGNYTASATAFTFIYIPACEPTPTNKSASTWYQGDKDTEVFTFSHSGVGSEFTKFYYKWDRSQSSSVTTGDTSDWTIAAKSFTPYTSKNMYLHVRPANSNEDLGPQSDLGPFYFVDTERLLKHGQFFDEDGEKKRYGF